MNDRTRFPGFTDTDAAIVHDLPITEYHAARGLSNTGLSNFAKSPARYYSMHLDPDRPPREETPGQLVGHLAHCAILEPAHFDTRYVVGPCEKRTLKKWKDWAAERGGDDDAIRPVERAAALAQAASVKRIPEVAALLAVGEPEVSAFWTDPETGVLCRCRPDWVHPVNDEAVILADVKTCGDASPSGFARQVARMGYQRQAAFYSAGYEIASGKRVLAFVFISVETEWPYAASACMLDDDSLDLGRREVAGLLPRFAECERTGVWPGYSNAIELIRLPTWAFTTPTITDQG